MPIEYDHGRDPGLTLYDAEPVRHQNPRSSESAEDIGGMTKAELVSLAEERGVDSSGSKAELAERLGAG
jgi:hypothetical protein